MAEIADWQRKNYKKVQSFADGGPVEEVLVSDADKYREEERVKQEEARELSTIKEVGEKKEKKPLPQFTPIAAGNIQITPDRFEMPPEYRESGRYTARVMAAAGMADGGCVKKGKR